MDEHLGYRKNSYSENPNSRNGYKEKLVHSRYDDMKIQISPEIKDWQNLPLSDVYPVIFIDSIHYSVRDNGISRKLAAYFQAIQPF